ncbi:esterase E4-like [Macrosteles quadrilineatus]|uniref:esterase E4-like n=1 Tax=Macrosteles quadrilineatus TaxID=74068 RepID=UPI0023E220F7|nr:esterase E4-like [Macrosteles quadrilineatus]
MLKLLRLTKVIKNAKTHFSIRGTSSNPVVTIEEGQLRGREVTATSFQKKKYFAFQGIPYAQPPVGKLRFNDPEPVKPWTGVRDALKEAPMCPQNHILLHLVLGEEDNCLALNVFTPRLPKSADEPLMPAMVWIHGGGFTFGSGNTDVHDPDYWMAQDVVIVTCNYRVGVLGFLSLGIPEASGNAGLKDQVMVLKWVQRNIAQFGGDPKKVTMFGESAGSASVHYHLLSPMSRDLIHGGILQSGSSLCTWAHSFKALENSFDIGKRLGMSTSDPHKLLEFLRGLPALEMVKIQYDVMTEQDKLDMRMFPFVPSVEVAGGEGQRFLTEHPRAIMQRGDIAPVPVISGANSKEGMLIMNEVNFTDDFFKLVDQNFNNIVPWDLGLPQWAPDKLRKHFYGDKPINWDTLDETLDFYGDIFFYLGIDEAVRYHVVSAKSPIFCYHLTYEGGQGLLTQHLRQKYPQAKLKGVSHADDWGYMFKCTLPDTPKISPGSTDEKMTSTITGIWRHFAETGNPNKEGLEVKWEPAVAEGSSWKNYLEINNPLAMKNTRMEKTRMELWDTLLWADTQKRPGSS